MDVRFLYIYIYIYIHAHTHIHVLCIYVCMYAYIHIHSNAVKRVWNGDIYTYPYPYTYAYIHTHTYTYTFIHIHTYTHTGTIKRLWNPGRFEVLAVAFSSDGAKVAAAFRDGTVMVFNVETGNEVYTLRGHSDWVTSVMW